MDDTTQVEWSFVGIESPYCQGRHSTERTTIYAYNSRPLSCVTTEYATLLTALAKPCMQLPFPMRDAGTLSAHSAATQQSIICLIRCAKPLFACIQLAAKTISLFLHTRKPSADSDFRTDMAKRHLNRGTDFKGNQTFSSIPQYTNMSEDMIPSNVVALANEIAHLYGDRN